MPEGRNAQGQWVKGTSGCPGGIVPKDRQRIDAVRQAALAKCPAAVRRLTELMADENGKVAVMAAMTLLKVGGVLSPDMEAARIEREVERRLRQLIDEAEREREPPAPEPRPMLEAV